MNENCDLCKRRFNGHRSGKCNNCRSRKCKNWKCRITFRPSDFMEEYCTDCKHLRGRSPVGLDTYTIYIKGV